MSMYWLYNKTDNKQILFITNIIRVTVQEQGPDFGFCQCSSYQISLLADKNYNLWPNNF